MCGGGGSARGRGGVAGMGGGESKRAKPAPRMKKSGWTEAMSVPKKLRHPGTRTTSVAYAVANRNAMDLFFFHFLFSLFTQP